VLWRSFPQGFKRDIQTNFVAVSKAIGNGLDWIVDRDLYTFNVMNFNAGLKGFARHVDDVQWQLTLFRSTGFMVNGKPHFKRVLSG
jgi:hypothetical protein